MQTTLSDLLIIVLVFPIYLVEVLNDDEKGGVVGDEK